jgi:hypothetical protein
LGIARLTVDGRRLKATRSTNFRLTVDVSKYRLGRHRLKIVAANASGGKATRYVSFIRCPAGDGRDEGGK